MILTEHSTFQGFVPQTEVQTNYFKGFANHFDKQLNGLPDRILATNPHTYLRADSGVITVSSDDSVAHWLDRSEHSRVFGQIGLTARPILKQNAVNGYPSVQFDGVNDILADVFAGRTFIENRRFWAFLHNHSCTITCVLKHDDTALTILPFLATQGSTTGQAGISLFIDNREGSGIDNLIDHLVFNETDAAIIDNRTANNVIADDTFSVITIVYSVTATVGANNRLSYIYVNGNNTPTKDTSSGSKIKGEPAARALQIGADTSGVRFFKGEITDILIWTRGFDSSQVMEIHQLFNDKYKLY